MMATVGSSSRRIQVYLFISGCRFHRWQLSSFCWPSISLNEYIPCILSFLVLTCLKGHALGSREVYKCCQRCKAAQIEIRRHPYGALRGSTSSAISCSGKAQLCTLGNEHKAILVRSSFPTRRAPYRLGLLSLIFGHVKKHALCV